MSSQHLFYIYEFPPSIINSWPNFYTHHRLSVDSIFHSNYGAGPLIREDIGLYHTHQYTLFSLFYERLLISKFRTTFPEEADIFFIPYDLGMDSSTCKHNGALLPTGCPNVEAVIKLLESSIYFNRFWGSNHFLLHSINQMMTYYGNRKCQKLYEFCFNCTKLSIDSYPSSVFSYLDSHPAITNKWLSIPFPSNYHFNNNQS